VDLSRIYLSILLAFQDGKLSADEAAGILQDLAEELLELGKETIAPALDEFVADIVAFVDDVLHRDHAELLAAAGRAAAKGKTKRAEKLLAKAAERAPVA
jgi:type III secretion system FlhB-like substrate exporter